MAVDSILWWNRAESKLNARSAKNVHTISWLSYYLRFFYASFRNVHVLDFDQRRNLSYGIWLSAKIAFAAFTTQRSWITVAMFLVNCRASNGTVGVAERDETRLTTSFHANHIDPCNLAGFNYSKEAALLSPAGKGPSERIQVSCVIDQRNRWKAGDLNARTGARHGIVLRPLLKLSILEAFERLRRCRSFFTDE